MTETQARTQTKSTSGTKTRIAAKPAPRDAARKRRAPPAANQPDPPGIVCLSAPEGTFEQATGTADADLQTDLLMQLSNTLWLPEGLSAADRQARLQAALSCLQDLKPSGLAEGMLATQMVACHAAIMECLRRAMMAGQSPQIREQNLKFAARLMGVYGRQMETLDRHRARMPPAAASSEQGPETLTIRRIIVTPDGEEDEFDPEEQAAQASLDVDRTPLPGSRGKAAPARAPPD